MSEVLLSIQSHTATLTLNRPNKGNALTQTMIRELISYLNQLKNDPKVRVIVLTGAGKYFCSGMDLSSSMGQENKDNSFSQGIEVFEILYHYPKPVIARVNGPCLGGGVGLVFTTDFRVVHQSAYFALTEVKRGLVPAIISKYIVPELGAQKSKEYMLTGRRVLPEELKGSMSALVVSNNELDDQVNQLAAQLLESAPGAMATIKQLVNTIDGDRERSQYAQTEIKKVFLNMVQSEEAAYGIQCFFTKQKPDWSTLSSKL